MMLDRYWIEDKKSVFFIDIAEVAELVDAHASGACAFGCTGSSPVFGTKWKKKPCSSMNYKAFLLIMSR